MYQRISTYIDKARFNVVTTIDREMLKTYWKIGKDIIDAEQQGSNRAKYGQELIANISRKLCENYGRGFSISNVRNMRQFYLEYDLLKSEYPIHYTVCSESQAPEFTSNLGWSHYRELMRVKRLNARAFYEIEASRNNWSARELQRQIGSLLYDRLAKSKDKEGLLALSYKGQEIIKPEDAIKEPLILEFLGLPEEHQYVESKLEEAIITNLQRFLLELGKGFAFIARQKRLTLDNEHFYADLVFYHVILKCYVIIDIKTKRLTHADLGQIQFYVNYFDQEIKTENDNPTIGLVLCTDKSDAMVRYTLGEKTKQIFASSYQFHLPTEAELEAELKREIKDFKQHSLKE
ncbi:hypothetical protein IM40_09620 (plasmid) [Candidatus Paracaedimonas acanthamoebae]|nr:hypothetical protein IM40_09620 [Candidatus Paracaedimonas acanthamoebae]